jgi:hypothetical protein
MLHGQQRIDGIFCSCFLDFIFFFVTIFNLGHDFQMREAGKWGGIFIVSSAVF